MISLGTTNKRMLQTAMIAAVLVLAALSCQFVRYITDNRYLDRLAAFLRTFLYLGMFSAWGVSVRQRVTQTQVRRYLTGVALLIVIWLIVREYRFRFVSDPDLQRYLWYAYYIPMMSIPMLALLISMSLDRPDEYRLPGWTYLVYFPTALIILGILSNDFHQLAFRFPESALFWSDHDYTHGLLYYLAVGWASLCAVLALFYMIRRSRIPGSGYQVWLPLLPFILALAHVILYTLRFPPVRLIAGDVAVFYCLIFAAFFELCMDCGLIRSNIYYEELFTSSMDPPMVITDMDYRVRYASGGAVPVPEELMRQAEAAPLILPEGLRLHNMPINAGHAVWTEDISSILKLREMLEDRREELQERNMLLQHEYEQEEQHRRIEEQNRLYDLLQKRTQTQLDRIEQLAGQYPAADDKEKKRILAYIMVLGSYVKRRKDLALSRQVSEMLPGALLSRAFAESFRALKLLGIRGGQQVDPEEAEYPAADLVLAYDFFEDVMEAVMDRAMYLNVRAGSVRGSFRVNLLTDAVFQEETELKGKYPGVRILGDDEGTQLILAAEEGGGK
ncbi:MAG: hypothetical protein IJ061_05155 [Lachnospiraceae bacterium]|nr:hypothetical protein [Lachnospiraceae bacterium]